MNMEKKKKEPKKPEDDSVLRKRRFNEVNDRKERVKNPNQGNADRSYSFKSPEESEDSINAIRNMGAMYNPEERSEVHPPPIPDPPRQIERFSSGISNLFSQTSNAASEKKSRDEGGDYINSLLNTSYKKKGSPNQNENKKLHI